MDSTDNETGEIRWARHFEPLDACDIDMETGEFDSNISTLPIRKTPFVIPKELIQPPKHDATKLCCMDAHENYTLFKKEQVIGLQEVFIELNICFFVWFFFYLPTQNLLIISTIVLCRI